MLINIITIASQLTGGRTARTIKSRERERALWTTFQLTLIEIFVWSSKRRKPTHFCHDYLSSSFVRNILWKHILDDWRLWKLIFQPELVFTVLHAYLFLSCFHKIWLLCGMFFHAKWKLFFIPSRSFGVHSSTRLRKVLITVTSTKYHKFL